MSAREKKVTKFNEANPVGTSVAYWPGVREGEGKTGKTRSEAFLASGHTPVVFIEGQPGYVALTHVQPKAKAKRAKKSSAKKASSKKPS